MYFNNLTRSTFRIFAICHFDSEFVKSGINEQETNLGKKFVGVTQKDLWKREQGNLRVHHLANAGTVLNILRDNQHPFSKCVNINSVDIVDGKNELVYILHKIYCK